MINVSSVIVIHTVRHAYLISYYSFPFLNTYYFFFHHAVLIEYSFNLYCKKESTRQVPLLSFDCIPAHLKDHIKIHIRKHGSVFPPFFENLLDRIVTKADKKSG